MRFNGNLDNKIASRASVRTYVSLTSYGKLLTVVNTGRAKWICRANAGSSAGAVCVNVGGESFDISSDVGRHGLITVGGVFVTADNYKNVTMEMSAEGRAHFGEKIKFTVKTV